MDSFMPILVAVLLAIYGWYLITKLAKCREAQDLYSYIIKLIKQIESDRLGTLKSNTSYLERQMTGTLASIELGLNLIKKYYRHKSVGIYIDNQEIIKLRRYLTSSIDLLDGINDEEERNIEIQNTINSMCLALLNESYEYTNQMRTLWPRCITDNRKN